MAQQRTKISIRRDKLDSARRYLERPDSIVQVEIEDRKRAGRLPDAAVVEITLDLIEKIQDGTYERIAQLRIMSQINRIIADKIAAGIALYVPDAKVTSAPDGWPRIEFDTHPGGTAGQHRRPPIDLQREYVRIRATAN